ncbi:DUF2786 domain-containing protein [Amantichitinum ursilacus]|uniref:Uncharacterized protein n=1 Tax=Amantichitinum ursilacus TaxID=857265 RepID=A0A0N1JSS8_9NEIS|nr:DUF2786 domain-containing protein [Amantichitinum ursilacus]KPC52998.1 hypothetical protein WG78_10925 [Amantichitinum ursilacus]
MDKQTAIAKIRKCMALAKSANGHEAGVALRQAQALIEKFGVDEAQLLAAEVTQTSARANARKTPARWESGLADTVAGAFGCGVMFVACATAGEWRFIGPAVQSEIAGYAHTILNRRIKAARAELLRSPACRRLLAKTRTARADLFCEQFVLGLREHVREFAGTKAELAIEAFITTKYPTAGTMKPKNRNAARKLTVVDFAVATDGYTQGRLVRLNHAVGAAAEKAAALTGQLALGYHL